MDAINDGLGEYYDWNGVSGITSTSAGTNATGDAGVVPYSNNDLYALSIGTVSLDDGTGNPDTTKTILAYTYLADATLSGTVTSRGLSGLVQREPRRSRRRRRVRSGRGRLRRQWRGE